MRPKKEMVPSDLWFRLVSPPASFRWKHGQLDSEPAPRSLRVFGFASDASAFPLRRSAVKLKLRTRRSLSLATIRPAASSLLVSGSALPAANFAQFHSIALRPVRLDLVSSDFTPGKVSGQDPFHKPIQWSASLFLALSRLPGSHLIGVLPAGSTVELSTVWPAYRSSSSDLPSLPVRQPFSPLAFRITAPGPLQTVRPTDSINLLEPI